MAQSGFLKHHRDPSGLIVYKKAECIFVLAHHFANRFFTKPDRTIDQMVQAARSGKQNIMEGCTDGETSIEMKLKLLNVARGSLKELRADFEDYLMVNGLSPWGEEKQRRVREFCKTHNDWQFYREIAPQRDAETLCNLSITLIHQVCAILLGFIKKTEEKFLTEGGIKETMYKSRTAARH